MTNITKMRQQVLEDICNQSSTEERL